MGEIIEYVKYCWGRFRGYLIPVVGFRCLNDYHIYYDTRKEDFTIYGYDCVGDWMETITLRQAHKALVDAIRGMNTEDTLSRKHALILKKRIMSLTCS